MEHEDQHTRMEAELLAHQKRLRLMTAELSLAEERERRRIAMDIHDSIGQTLAIIKMKLKALRISADSPEFIKKIDEILEYADQTILETRSLSHELSSPVLYTLGLEAAVENLVEKLQKKHGLSIEFTNDGLPKPLVPPSMIHLYRSVRELMFNIIKHARAQQVRVHMAREDNDIRIVIEDDGCGFDSSRATFQPDTGGGFGLFSIRERLIHLGGRFIIHSDPGKGTQVILSAPLNPDAV